MARKPKIIDVVGARPQFVKLAALWPAMKAAPLDYVLVNTDQHYDDLLRDVFFTELKIKKPDYSLGIGSGTHAEQTGRMMVELEKVFTAERPDLVQVYGDTNSTLAASLTAAKLGIPISHIEAGLRSFNRAMPEEINRVLTDHLAQLLFVPTKQAVKQLKKEGVAKGVHRVGDVMLDLVESWKRDSSPLPRLVPNPYVLATIHRAENTDDRERLQSIFSGFAKAKVPIVLPMHPRLSKMVSQLQITVPANVVSVQPLSYHGMMSALHHASCVATDSGGLQKEAYYMGRFCVTIRDETEWVELVRAKVNVLSGADANRIARLISSGMEKRVKPGGALYREYGAGKAAARIVAKILSTLK